MNCRECRKAISGPDVAKAHIQRDEQGRLVAAFHNKCFLARRKTRDPNRPSAYEMSRRRQTADDFTEDEQARKATAEEAYRRLIDGQSGALDARRAELEEDRKKESAPSSWDDWRDPDSIEF